MTALKASLERENSPLAEALRFVAAALLGTGLAFASLPAQAAQGASAERHETKAAKDKGTALAARDPDTTSSIQAADGEANCARSRQRLFVEGEGWIVRRVTTCY